MLQLPGINVNFSEVSKRGIIEDRENSCTFLNGSHLSTINVRATAAISSNRYQSAHERASLLASKPRIAPPSPIPTASTRR